MNGILDLVTSGPDNTFRVKMVNCIFEKNENISGELYGGLFLILTYRNGNYANITALSYWGHRVISVGCIENGTWTKRFESAILKPDLALLSFTWTGEATNYIDTSITIDGYKPIAITGLNPTGLGTTEALRYFRFNKNNLRAIASFTAKTVTSCVFDVLCMRI